LKTSARSLLALYGKQFALPSIFGELQSFSGAELKTLTRVTRVASILLPRLLLLCHLHQRHRGRLYTLQGDVSTLAACIACGFGKVSGRATPTSVEHLLIPIALRVTV
jgi:hypothetical protein